MHEVLGASSIMQLKQLVLHNFQRIIIWCWNLTTQNSQLSLFTSHCIKSSKHQRLGSSPEPSSEIVEGMNDFFTSPTSYASSRSWGRHEVNDRNLRSSSSQGHRLLNCHVLIDSLVLLKSDLLQHTSHYASKPKK